MVFLKFGKLHVLIIDMAQIFDKRDQVGIVKCICHLSHELCCCHYIKTVSEWISQRVSGWVRVKVRVMTLSVCGCVSVSAQKWECVYLFERRWVWMSSAKRRPVFPGLTMVMLPIQGGPQKQIVFYWGHHDLTTWTALLSLMFSRQWYDEWHLNG